MYYQAQPAFLDFAPPKLHVHVPQGLGFCVKFQPNSSFFQPAKLAGSWPLATCTCNVHPG